MPVKKEHVPENQILKSIGIFLLLTGLLALPFYMLAIEVGLKRHYMAALMWSPGLAALMTCKIQGIKITSLGFGWGRSTYHIAAYILPMIYGVLAYGLIWSFGFATVLDPAFLKEATYYFGDLGASEGVTIAFSVLMLATVGMLWHIPTALGEEIGWRGFLSVLLMRRYNFAVSVLITGVIWALWHFPIIIYTTYNAGPADLHIQLLNYTVLCIGLSSIMLYLQIKSQSVWAPTILHAAHNVFLLSILKSMTHEYEDSWQYVGEFGAVIPVTVLLFGLLTWRKAQKEGISGPLPA